VNAGQRMSRNSSLQILKGGALYFILVFAAGFVLGTIRTLWVAPLFGARKAELVEAPVMLVVIFFSARWVARRLALPSSRAPALGVGLIALSLLLLAEFTVVLWIRGLTIAQYLAGRDPIAGTVYLAMLAIFALMPMMLAGRQISSPIRGINT
jgi:type IV secretory pathway TrbD component